MNRWLRLLGAGLLTAWAAHASAQDLRLVLPPEDDLRDRLRAVSLLDALFADEEAARPLARREVVAAAQADYRRLVSALFAEGYFAPVVSIAVDGVEAEALPVVGRRDPVSLVTVTVQAGPRFVFGRAAIGPLAPRTELPDAFAPGQPAGTEPIRDAASASIERWREVGHAKADIASEDIVADHAARRLDVDLGVAPGPRVALGPLTVRGAERVREDRIRKIVDLDRGQVFDPDEIDRATRRLLRTGAFRSVAITEGDRLIDGNRLPLTVAVVEELPRRFGAGVEIASEEGLSLSGFWLHRNLTGRADSFRVEAEARGLGGGTGGEDYGISFAYNRPSSINAETDLFVTGGLRSEDQPLFQSDQAELTVGARRYVSEEFQYSYALSYRFSDVTDAFGSRTFNIVSLPLAATYDRRDDDLNPSDGYYVDATLSPFFGTETTGGGLRFTADLRGYEGFLADDRLVIAGRLQLGTVMGPDLRDTPPEDLFFSGGGGTVRGQGFQDLGVTLPSGRRVGGKSLAVFSAEARFGITDAIGLVGFYDIGLVSPDADWGGGETHSGAGLGLRYDTGIGPIRLDVGLPVSGPDGDGVQVYIGIGQAF